MNIQSILIRLDGGVEYEFTGNDIVGADVKAVTERRPMDEWVITHKVREYHITLTINATSGVVRATGMGGPDELPAPPPRRLPGV